MSQTDPDFKTRFKNARLALKLRQIDIAQRLGVNRSTVSNWEAARRTPISAMHLFRAAKMLRVDPAWLCFGDGSDAAINLA